MAEKKATKTSVTKADVKVKKDHSNPVSRYFKGAWFELSQVRWPDRKATWGLTLAVILFSVFFAIIILGLDFVFQYLFKKVIF